MILDKKKKMNIVNRTYRHLIEIWELDHEVENELGEWEQQPKLIDKIWAEVEPIRGKEYLEHHVIIPEMTHRITTRYRPHIHQGMVVKWQGRELNIESIIDVGGWERHMEMLCVEKVET